MSVSCESGNKNKKKKEDKHEKVTVSYESVRKNQQDSSCDEEAQKKVCVLYHSGKQNEK